MRRIAKFLAWTLAVLLALPALLLALVLIGGNTGPGRRMIERYTPTLTGGAVQIAGLSGRFPDRLRAASVQIDDQRGPYLTLDRLVLDWSPWQLLHGMLDIDRLDASAASFTRMPEPSTSTSKSSGLPVAVRLRQFQVDQLTVAPAVAGKSYVVALQGAGTLQSMDAGNGHLLVQQVGGSGRYSLDGSITAQSIRATITAQEQAHGLIAGVAGLPDVGPIDVHATLDGPRSALATNLTASAGPLRANVAGMLDLTQEAANLTVAATAPAMTPRPDVSWQDVAVNARVSGPFKAPSLSGQVRIDALQAMGAAIGRFTADLSGTAGQAQLHAVLDHLALPGQDPSLFAAAPMVLDATAQLDAPDRPIRFTLQHPLVEANGTARTKGPLQARVALTLPELAPLAAAAGQTVEGHTALTLDVDRNGTATDIALRGTIGVTGGQPQAAALLGKEARVDLAASLEGQNARLNRLHVTGRSADISARGSLVDSRAQLDWTASIADLSAIDAALNGKLDASGTVSGPEQDLAASVSLHGDIGSQNVQSGPVTVQVEAKGLPHNPNGTVTAQGSLLNAPIDVAAAVSRTAGGIDVTVQRADWKSLQAHGALTLPAGATIPTGTLHLQMTQLADLSPLLGQKLAGSVSATLDSSAAAAKLAVAAKGLALSGGAVSHAALDATVTHPQDHPVIAASLKAEGVRTGSVAGATARIEARGPENAIAVAVTTSAPDLSGSAARLNTTAIVDIPARAVSLSTLRAAWKGQDLRLLAPARLDLANGAAVDHLRLGLGSAVLALNGRVSPTLDLTADLRNLPVSLANSVSPKLQLGGTIAATARLTGTPAKPVGTARLTATGLRDNSPTGRALPPANLIAEAMLHGTDTGLNVHLTAGSSHFAVTGTAPLARTGALNLHTTGALDLALLNPILTAGGRRVRGELTLAANVSGTASAPRLAGTARLTGGEAQDFPMGVHVTDITGLVQADGDHVRLAQLSARAGDGTISAHGAIGLAAPMPINLVIAASNARLLASPLITATIGSNLTVQGDVEGAMTVAGRVDVQNALVQVPDKLPSSVAVIPVRVAGAPPPPPSPKPVTAPAQIALNITLDTPGQVVVRGRGLNVTLGGTMTIRGTAANPQPSGGLNLQHGTMNLISQTLTFNQGSIDFVGTGITDPGIHLVATSSNSTITATLTVSGTAQDPKITLSSTPDLPQDQILAQLLFGQGIGTLSPFQVAQIAAGLAQLSGTGGGATDPLAGLRNSLGLDQLTVGSSSTGAPTVDVGRQLAPGVYLGAQQSAVGNGTEATLQVNLAKGLKLQTSAGTATPSATGAASSGQAASVGLTYQFQY